MIKLAHDNNALDLDILKGERELELRRRPFVLYGDLGVAAPKEMLVRDLLGAGEASATYGKPGDGKSVLAEDMGLHVSSGRPWHGRQVKQGLVVYFALERQGLVKRRAIAFREHHGLENLPFAIVGGIYDLRDPRTAQLAADIVRQAEDATEHKAVLVEIDTVSRALCGGDENSPKDMGALVNSTAILQERTGAHVLWVHHMPHDGERMRGHGALLGAMDTTLHVASNGNVRSATVVKANDSEEGERITFTLESVTIATDADGNKTTAPVVLPAEAGQAGPSEPKLTANQRTMFSILHDAEPSGLTLEEWNGRARDAGLGVNRKADLHDFRSALAAKRMVTDRNGRWHVLS